MSMAYVHAAFLPTFYDQITSHLPFSLSAGISRWDDDGGGGDGLLHSIALLAHHEHLCLFIDLRLKTTVMCGDGR